MKRKHFLERKSGIALKGVHNVIATRFLPFHPSKLRYRLTAPAQTVLNPRCYGTSDTDHGAHVDQDLKLFAAGSARGKQLTDDALDAAVRTAHRRCCDPCSLAIVRAIRQLGWRVCASQQPVGCMQARVATAYDLRCEDTRNGNETVIVEIKTSKHRTNAFYEQPVPGAFICIGDDTRLPYSYHNVDMMQLQMTCALAKRTVECEHALRGALLRVGACGRVWHYPMPRDELGERMLAELARKKEDAAYKARRPTKRKTTSRK